jgi:hypothetical protein
VVLVPPTEPEVGSIVVLDVPEDPPSVPPPLGGSTESPQPTSIRALDKMTRRTKPFMARERSSNIRDIDLRVALRGLESGLGVFRPHCEIAGALASTITRKNGVGRHLLRIYAM